jgi:hypothetical protein
MQTEKMDTPSNTGTRSFALLLLAAGVIYMLAVGPAFRLAMNGNAPTPVANCVGIIYTPLFGLARGVPPFGQFLFWYLDLWGWRPAFA